jgi:hypothetical protein
VNWKNCLSRRINLLPVRSPGHGDGLKPAVAASASQSQGSYRQEDNEGAEPVHGDLLLEI